MARSFGFWTAGSRVRGVLALIVLGFVVAATIGSCQSNQKLAPVPEGFWMNGKASIGLYCPVRESDDCYALYASNGTASRLLPVPMKEWSDVTLCNNRACVYYRGAEPITSAGGTMQVVSVAFRGTSGIVAEVTDLTPLAHTLFEECQKLIPEAQRAYVNGIQLPSDGGYGVVSFSFESPGPKVIEGRALAFLIKQPKPDAPLEPVGLAVILDHWLKIGRWLGGHFITVGGTTGLQVYDLKVDELLKQGRTAVEASDLPILGAFEWPKGTHAVGLTDEGMLVADKKAQTIQWLRWPDGKVIRSGKLVAERMPWVRGLKRYRIEAIEDQPAAP